VSKSENLEKSREHWKQKLNDELLQPEEPVLVITIRRGWNSAARPVLVRGIDRKEYVIKGQQAGRQVINDQVVARLGVAMGAPVGQPAIMEISSDLIEEDLNFNYLTVGTAHGTVFIADCSDDREPVNYIHQSENRARFALLCVLYGWVYSNDCQFIYKKSRPNLVYSVDHGHFFPGGPNWTKSDLMQAHQAELDPFLHKRCKFTTDETSSALLALQRVSEETIIQAVAAPPNEWGLTLDERVTLVEYLIRKQQQLLTVL
jgi:hypothetical protein